MTRQEYELLPQINQSKLSTLRKKGIEFINSRDDSSGFKLGNLFDKLIAGKECYYRIGKAPSQDSKLFGLAGSLDEVVAELSRLDYGGTRGFSLATIRNKASDYEDYFIANAQGIPTISLAEESDLLAALDHTKKLKLYYSDGNFCQYFITDEKKAELDLVKIFDHVIHIVDFKWTSFPPTMFQYSIWKYDYQFQAAFYVDLVKEFYPDHQIEFYFIAANGFGAVPFKLSQESYELGKSQYQEMLELYNWHVKNNVFTNKELYEQGYIETSVQGIH
jgi:PDDEXK-like domain of unknown function (DUF3799)